MDADGIRDTLHRLARSLEDDLLTQVAGIKNPSMQIIGRHGWLDVGYDEITGEWEYYWDGPRTSFDPDFDTVPL